MSGALIAAGVIAAGTAAYAGYSSNQASKKAANQMREGVQTVDPIQPTYQLTGLNKPQTVDWRVAVNDALNYNINHQARQQQLAAQTNLFNTRQAQRQYRTFQPHFDSLQRQLGENALSFSQGELPADVVASLGRSAASRGLNSGFGLGARGGGNGTALGNSLLRGLGLTSLDLSKFGSQLAMQAGLQAKQLSPALFDPTSLMVSPQQAVGYEMQNANTMNEAARYWNQLQNQALMGNVSAQNTANQNAINTQLAGSLAQSQAIAQAGSSTGNALWQYGMYERTGEGGGANPYATNQGYIPSAPSGGAVSGYGYNPSSGYYRLS